MLLLLFFRLRVRLVPEKRQKPKRHKQSHLYPEQVLCFEQREPDHWNKFFPLLQDRYSSLGRSHSAPVLHHG